MAALLLRSTPAGWLRTAGQKGLLNNDAGQLMSMGTSRCFTAAPGALSASSVKVLLLLIECSVHMKWNQGL